MTDEEYIEESPATVTVQQMMDQLRMAIQSERQRCAKIAESASCVYSGPALRVEGWDLCKHCISSRIRIQEVTDEEYNRSLALRGYTLQRKLQGHVAIEKERERCAKIAEYWGSPGCQGDYKVVVIERIRSGE